MVVGVHPVREVLRAGGRLDRVLVDVGRGDGSAIDEIGELAAQARVRVERVDRDQIEHHAAGLVHQGVVALGPPFPYVGLAEVLARTERQDRPALLVALDGITDPHNVGSIARSAEAVGADALIMPSRRAAGVTATVEKAAAGALAHLDVVRVPNLVRALKDAKQTGCWVVGLAAGTGNDIADTELLGESLVLVIGSEGNGLAHLTGLECDLLVELPMRGSVSSLNASVAASVALYEVLRQRDRQ